MILTTGVVGLRTTIGPPVTGTLPPRTGTTTKVVPAAAVLAAVVVVVVLIVAQEVVVVVVRRPSGSWGVSSRNKAQPRPNP